MRYGRQEMHKDIGNVESLGQHRARNQPIDSAVRLAELGNLCPAFVIVSIEVADLLEIEARISELAAELRAMLHRGREHDGLGRPAEMLVGLLDPCLHNIANDCDAA